MSQVRDEELSALIDGALDPARALQVQAAIAADPALRAEYEALSGLDAQLHDAGKAASFMPDIALPASAAESNPVHEWAILPAAAVMLLLVRLTPKFVDMAMFGWLLQIVATGAILFLVVKMAGERDGDAVALSRL